MNKQKRSHETSSTWQLALAKLGAELAAIFAVVAIADIRSLFTIYGTIAGMVMTMFLGMLASGVFLGLLWRQYRGLGEYYKANVIKHILLALMFVMVASVYVFVTRF